MSSALSLTEHSPRSRDFTEREGKGVTNSSLHINNAMDSHWSGLRKRMTFRRVFESLIPCEM
jgi:hypothetical protein